MMDIGGFEDAIRSFDGVHTAVLRRAATSCIAPPEALNRFVYCGSDKEKAAATWIFKELAVLGLLREDANDPVRKILSALDTDLPWDAALHLLQSVQHFPERAAHIGFDRWRRHKRVLVRVWALDAATRCDPVGLKESVRDALKDQSAAMRARARRLHVEVYGQTSA